MDTNKSSSNNNGDDELGPGYRLIEEIDDDATTTTYDVYYDGVQLWSTVTRPLAFSFIAGHKEAMANGNVQPGEEPALAKAGSAASGKAKSSAPAEGGAAKGGDTKSKNVGGVGSIDPSTVDKPEPSKADDANRTVAAKAGDKPPKPDETVRKRIAL